MCILGQLYEDEEWALTYGYELRSSLVPLPHLNCALNSRITDSKILRREYNNSLAAALKKNFLGEGLVY